MQPHRDCAWSSAVFSTAIAAFALSSQLSLTSCVLLAPPLCLSSWAGTSGQNQVHLNPKEEALLSCSMATDPAHGLPGEGNSVSCRAFPGRRSGTDLHAGPALRAAPAWQACARHHLHRLCQPCHWQPGLGCWGARDGLDTSLCKLQHSRYYLAVWMCLVIIQLTIAFYVPEFCRTSAKRHHAHANSMNKPSLELAVQSAPLQWAT